VPRIACPSQHPDNRLRTEPDALVLRVIDMGERARRCCRATPTGSSRRRTTTGIRTCSRGSTSIDPVELAELLEDSWRLRAPKRLVAAWDVDEGAARD